MLVCSVQSLRTNPGSRGHRHRRLWGLVAHGGRDEGRDWRRGEPRAVGSGQDRRGGAGRWRFRGAGGGKEQGRKAQSLGVSVNVPADSGTLPHSRWSPQPLPLRPAEAGLSRDPLCDP